MKTLHPDGGPLENVSDAFAVSKQLDEQSDALLGYFVDQARRSGLPWSQIGAAMGVSKQAAQKRFVPGQASDHLPRGRLQDVLPFHRPRRPRPVRRRPPRGRSPAPPSRRAGESATRPATARPAGRRARAGRAGREGHPPRRRHPRAALRGPRHRARPAAAEPDRAALLELTLDESAKEAFREALKWALRLGHDYIGTEHLLLGVLFTGGRPPRGSPPSA